MSTVISTPTATTVRDAGTITVNEINVDYLRNEFEWPDGRERVEYLVGQALNMDVGVEPTGLHADGEWGVSPATDRDGAYSVAEARTVAATIEAAAKLADDLNRQAGGQDEAPASTAQTVSTLQELDRHADDTGQDLVALIAERRDVLSHATLDDLFAVARRRGVQASSLLPDAFLARADRDH